MTSASSIDTWLGSSPDWFPTLTIAESFGIELSTVNVPIRLIDPLIQILPLRHERNRSDTLKNITSAWASLALNTPPVIKTHSLGYALTFSIFPLFVLRIACASRSRRQCISIPLTWSIEFLFLFGRRVMEATAVMLNRPAF